MLPHGVRATQLTHASADTIYVSLSGLKMVNLVSRLEEIETVWKNKMLSDRQDQCLNEAWLTVSVAVIIRVFLRPPSEHSLT